MVTGCKRENVRPIEEYLQRLKEIEKADPHLIHHTKKALREDELHPAIFPYRDQEHSQLKTP